MKKKTLFKDKLGKKKALRKNPLEKQTFEKKSKKCFQKETTPWGKYNPFEIFLIKKHLFTKKKKQNRQKNNVATCDIGGTAVNCSW